MDLVRSIGADHVIDYIREDVADGRQRYDVILDIGGNRSLSDLRRALTPQGTLVLVGAESSSSPCEPAPDALRGDERVSERVDAGQLRRQLGTEMVTGGQ